MTDVLKKFGRYFLLDHLAQGGMAEIYRARMASQDGGGRLIVIKKIQAGYGTNAEFLQMFKSEIKTTMGFAHPNIVQVYDFGEEETQPYIAMEWVDGKNLRQFMSCFAELKQTFPIELAIYIAEQAASGLNYAHSFRDKITGKPLEIVHRDISPQNILISFEGNVKVIDFGIAKATTNSESTRAGVIKGKPSYLSPEQISGDQLDGRSDIFALGAVLWELLTGRKLFGGENALAVLKLIESAQTHVKPPSTINPKIPKELDYIVLKTLHKQREKRYQSAEELQRALHKFLYSFASEFNPADLAYYAKDLFKNEIVADRKHIQRLYEKVELLLTTQSAEAASAQAKKSSDLEIGVGNDQKIELNSPNSSNPNDQQQTGGTPTMVDPRLRSSGGREAFTVPQNSGSKLEIDDSGPATRTINNNRTSAVNSINANRDNATSLTKSSLRPKTIRSPAYGGGNTQIHQRPRKSAPTSSFGILKMAVISTSVAAIGVFACMQMGIKIPYLSPPFDPAAPFGTAPPASVPAALNRNTASLALPPPAPGNVFAPIPETVPAATTPAVPLGNKMIVLKLQIFPNNQHTEVILNGKPVAYSTTDVPVSMDTRLDLVVNRTGFKSFHREFTLDSAQVGGLKESLLEVLLEPLHFGFITIHATPSADAYLTYDGMPWKKKTPIENEKLPVGTYQIHLLNELLGMEKTTNVSVQEGRLATVDERLEIKN